MHLVTISHSQLKKSLIFSMNSVPLSIAIFQCIFTRKAQHLFNIISSCKNRFSSNLAAFSALFSQFEFTQNAKYGIIIVQDGAALSSANSERRSAKYEQCSERSEQCNNEQSE